MKLVEMVILLVRCQGVVMEMIALLWIQVGRSWSHKGDITSRVA